MPSRTFRFRLESVRTVRKHNEDAAAQALAASVERCRESEAELRCADERIAAAREVTRDGRDALRSGADLVAAQTWLECAERARELLAQNVVRDQRDVIVRRAALGTAVSERKALDNLASRSRLAFQRELARVEAITLDEMALAAHARRAVV
jgi:flagellar export protein FliJ